MFGKTTEKEAEKFPKLIAIAGILFLLLSIALSLFHKKIEPEISGVISNLGSIGDFFGGFVNPAIAGMALFWLMRGVTLQQKELEETKKALQASEQHQANQVKVAALAALLDVANNKYESIDRQIKKIHDDHAAQKAGNPTFISGGDELQVYYKLLMEQKGLITKYENLLVKLSEESLPTMGE